MNKRRTPTRRVEDGVVNKVVPPQGDQVPQGEQVPLVNKENEVPVVSPDMSNEEVKRALISLARALTDQANTYVGLG